MPRRPSFESGPSWRFSSEEGARRYCAMSLPLILIGAVTRAQGLKGALRVVPYLGAMEDYEGLRSVTLVTEGGREERKVRACRPHGKVLIVELEGLDDRDAAEACVGASLYADRSQLPDLEEGEFYKEDLLDAAVVTEEGAALGAVTGFIDTGSNDVLVVRDGPHTHLIPALRHVLVRLDRDAGVLWIDPPPGLLEDGS